MAIAFAAAPVIGQNFGAGNGGRVKQAIRHVLIAVSTVMAAQQSLRSGGPNFC